MNHKSHKNKTDKGNNPLANVCSNSNKPTLTKKE